MGSVADIEGIRNMSHASNSVTLIFFFFYICTVHLDTIKVYSSPTNAQVIVLKTILKFTLK
jgi:hypothetical protein